MSGGNEGAVAHHSHGQRNYWVISIAEETTSRQGIVLVRGNLEVHWRAVDSILLLLLLITENAPEPSFIRILQQHKHCIVLLLCTIFPEIVMQL